MEFKVIQHDAKDFYEVYKKWCKGHNFPARNVEELDIAFVSYRGDTPLYSTFIWRTPSTFCVLGFPVSNPDIPYIHRKGALGFLFSEVSRQLKEMGFKIIWTTSDTERVVEGLIDSGFQVADTKVDQYYKVLF
ncbi:structural protein [Cellulophaga phage phi40:1]|uniref:Structural protein n=1 Tax=Cellulophaga phage phi38:1 TaxID=1327977 RepID=S0A1R3_9CAUD|nr:structural protein [Cellulophaga phage phi38:1]AGO47963.1 structural protein [Cellulophaga phage phi40:1]AGO48128.1 structural protein [Cellulophaga phage phi38:1]